jgi:glycosidase
MMPAIGILTDDEIQALVDKTLRNGGFVSYKANPDGSKSVYELNISYIDALAEPRDDQNTLVQKFMASQAIMLAMQGVPGIYVHSLFGSRSDREAVLRTGVNRAINRAKFDRFDLERELSDEKSLRHRVYAAYKHLLSIRTNHVAFHPNAAQRVLNLHPSVFALVRTPVDRGGSVIALQNVSGEKAEVRIDLSYVPGAKGRMTDLVSGVKIEPATGVLTIGLSPYQTMWLAGDE